MTVRLHTAANFILVYTSSCVVCKQKLKKRHALTKLIRCIFDIMVVCQNQSNPLRYKLKLSALIDKTQT